jgi:YcxB-like protein
MRFDFQLTFDEYHEAVRLARRRLARAVARRFRVQFWIGVIVTFVIVELVLKAIDRLVVTPAGFNPAAQPWQETLRPYLLFIVSTWIVIAAILMALRRRLKLVDRILWEARAQLQQVRSAEFDETGATFSDPLTRQHYDWLTFREVKETRDAVVLFTSPYSFEAIPRRACADKLDEFRQFLHARITPRTQGFPVHSPTGEMPPPSSGPSADS